MQVWDRDELWTAYRMGERRFREVNLDGQDLTGLNLRGASFYGASLRGADLRGCHLEQVQFKGGDLRDACLQGVMLNGSDLIAASFAGADLRGADLTGAIANRVDWSGADLRNANLGNARLAEGTFIGADLLVARVAHTDFTDVDVAPFCETRLAHSAPSTIDSRTVMRSYRHPQLKDFMLDCGVPEVFAEFMIECARALGDSTISQLMQTTFISYGGPDEPFARRLYDALRAHGVVVFFFPETARLGERIDSEVYHQLQRHDRVVLVCSRASLTRPGVLHEIRETLDREARDGGATYLLPITLDNWIFEGWIAEEPELAERIARRVVGDFRNAVEEERVFDEAFLRLLAVLKRKIPSQTDSGK